MANFVTCFLITMNKGKRKEQKTQDTWYFFNDCHYQSGITNVSAYSQNEGKR